MNHKERSFPDLYRRFAGGGIDRREFLRRAGTLGLGGISGLSLLDALDTNDGSLLAQLNNSKKELSLAEWSYFWVGVENEERPAAGNLKDGAVNGRQMYVEYQIPARQTFPYPIVLVHGGGGQGTDWMGTPDGRRGWSSHLVEEGFAVYIVDRPGHGRSPFHPDISGPFPAQAQTLEMISTRFTPQAARQPGANALVKRHNRWTGSGEVGSKELTQLVAAEGGSYLTSIADAHAVWRKNGVELLDKIGPAIIMTHSAGGPFGLLAAEERPKLVKGLVIIEGAGAAFAGPNAWGLSTIPVTYDPPVREASELRIKTVTASEPGVGDYQIQEEPARKLPNLVGIPVAFVTAEASFASPGNPGAAAFINQAGGNAEEIRLGTQGVRGNGHMMMVEKNNRDVLKVILKWIDKKVSKSGASSPSRKNIEAGPLKLSDQGFYWVGARSKKTDYGTIVAGQMYVQYLIPSQVRFPFPVVLIHGGGGGMTHYFGSGGGQAGWAHYYLMAGYRVYLVDRVGHGRSPYHPDALGPIGPLVTYSTVTPDFLRADPKVRVGSGEMGDPLIDQFQAGQNSIPTDNALAREMVTRGGAELLEKIGPAIIQTHSAGGAFGWLIANEKPRLTRAVVCVEGGGVQNLPVRMDNLRQFPIALVTAELSGRAEGSTADAMQMREGGCTVTDLQLKDRGVLGNGHFMMLEQNRKEVFEVIRGWIEENVARGKA